MTGISFMVDERGNKTASVIDLRRHRRVWEDFYDALLVHSRAREPRQRVDQLKRRFRLRRA